MRRSDAQAQLIQIFERLPREEQLAIRCCVLGDRDCVGDLVVALVNTIYKKHRAVLGFWSPWRYPTLVIVVARVSVLERLEDRRFSRRAIAKQLGRTDLSNADYKQQVLSPLIACRYELKHLLRSVEGTLGTV